MTERVPYVFMKMPKHEVQSPAVSVIIPTYNRASSLRAVLDALVEQTVPATLFEVLVISDGSTDGSDRVCAQLHPPYRLRFFEQHNQGPAAARNLGVSEAGGNIVLFLDDDVVPERSLLAEHLRVHQEDPRAAVIGPLLPPGDVTLQPWVQWEENKLLKQYDHMQRHVYRPTPRQFYTGNASVSRAAVVEVGGFDTSYTRAEDVEMAYRLGDLGLTFYFSPDARGWHYARRSFRSWLRIPDAYGRNDMRMAVEQGRTWILSKLGQEYFDRHRLVRLLSTVCVGHRYLHRSVVAVLVATAAVVSYAPGGVGMLLTQPFYSILFSLQYWHGAAETLGARQFWDLVRAYDALRKRPPPRDPVSPVVLPVYGREPV